MPFLCMITTAARKPPMSQDDARIAEIARRVAAALKDVAYSRKDADKKALAVVQTELCAAVDAEQQQEAGGGDTARGEL
jgi:hypothetical protein